MAAIVTLEDAARLLQSGSLGKAERCCQRILKRQPHNAQALHIMALAIHHGGRPAATIEGIRRCRRDIAALPADRIERKVLENRDFYSTSSCRDLIFHVQEHRFTLPRIGDMLAELGLRFIGFELNKPEVLNAYREVFPDDPDMTDLVNWHRFEQDEPDTFIAMYQFWCQKC